MDGWMKFRVLWEYDALMDEYSVQSALRSVPWMILNYIPYSKNVLKSVQID